MFELFTVKEMQRKVMGVHFSLHHISKIKRGARKLSGCPKPLILHRHFDIMFQSLRNIIHVYVPCLCTSSMFMYHVYVPPPINYPMENNYLCTHKFLVAVLSVTVKLLGTSYMLKNKVRGNTSSHLKSHCKE